MGRKAVEKTKIEVPYDSDMNSLAEFLGISERFVRELAHRGIFVKSTPGRYVVRDSMLRYIEHLRQTAAGRAGKDGGQSLAAERAETERVNRALSQLRLQRELNEVITRSEAAEGWATIARAVRGAVLGLVSKIRFVVPHLTAHDAEEIRKLCREILEDIAKEVTSARAAGAAPNDVIDGPPEKPAAKEKTSVAKRPRKRAA